MAAGGIKEPAGFNFQDILKFRDGGVGGQSALLAEQPGKIGDGNPGQACGVAERKPLFLNGFLQEPRSDA